MAPAKNEKINEKKKPLSETPSFFLQGLGDEGLVLRAISKVAILHRLNGQKRGNHPLGSPRKLVNGSLMVHNPLINGVYITQLTNHLLTSWDIQAWHDFGPLRITPCSKWLKTVNNHGL